MTLKRYFQMIGVGIPVALGMSLLSAVQNVVGSMGRPNHWNLTHALIMQTPCWLLWALLFPFIVWIVRRLPLERGSIRQHIVYHIGAAFGITFFHYGALLWIMHAIGHGYPQGHSYLVHFQESIRYQLWTSAVLYFSLFGVALIADYYRKYRERQLLTSQLEAQLAQARLHALRMQLNPHFLFNALNSIAMLTRANENASAVKMLAGLADLLRYVLQGSLTDEVTLREETMFLTQYLQIEKLRFRDRLDFRFDIAEETQDALIPNLLLQPIVENAVQHGVARKVSRGMITVSARRLGDRLVLQVTDDGPGLNSGPNARVSVGLNNTRQRLEQMYGGAQSCELRNGDVSGTVATLTLPFHVTAATEAVVVA